MIAKLIFGLLCGATVACAHTQGPAAVAIEVKTKPGEASSRDRIEADDATVQRGLGGALDSLNACYEASLKQDPNLEGDLTLAFNVGADGKATDISATGLLDPALRSCVCGVVAQTRFGAPYDHLRIMVTSANVSFRPVKRLVLTSP
jgi:hypothetical protein